MPSPQSGIRTKKKLLETAQDFLGRGDLEVNVETIAKEAGVSVGSLYTYFSDKNELCVSGICTN
jgi:AcrR family transcriptional regulator